MVERRTCSRHLERVRDYTDLVTLRKARRLKKCQFQVLEWFLVFLLLPSVQEVQKFADEAISCYCERSGQKGTGDGETCREGSHGAIVLHFVQTNRNEQRELERHESGGSSGKRFSRKRCGRYDMRNEVTDASWVPDRSVCA